MLLDTSGLLCLHHGDQPQHLRAVEFFDAAHLRVTHNYVLAEFVALAQVRGFPRAEVLSLVADLLDSTEVTVVFVDQALHQAAVSLLQRRLDKTWSLCDAVSFVLMEQLGIAEALTTDRHFEQAGYARLLAG